MTDNIDYITDREYKIGLLQSLNGRISLETDDKELSFYLFNIYYKYVSNQIKDDNIDFKKIETIVKDENLDILKVSNLIYSIEI